MSVGNIEKRGENKYRLTVSDGFDGNGKRIKYRKTITATCDRDAKKQLALFVSEVEKGQYVAPSKFTFAEFAKKWLVDYAEQNLKTKTLQRYKDLLRYKIISEIGHLKLEQIKPLHLVDFYTKLSSDGARLDGKSGGYSSKTIGHYHRLIHGMLEKATQWEMIPSNPASKVSPPKVGRREISFYDEEQSMKLIEELMNSPIKYKTSIILAIYTGMRREEILGLEWQDIDFNKQEIIIQRASQYTPEKGIYTDDLKTSSSYRTISIPTNIAELLLEYKAWQDEQKDKLGTLWTETGRIFTQESGTPMHPDTFSGWFSKFIKAKGLPKVTFHGLRHTNASILIANGVDLKTVSSRLGHASVQITTETYTHLIRKVEREAGNKMEEILNKKK